MQEEDQTDLSTPLRYSHHYLLSVHRRAPCVNYNPRVGEIIALFDAYEDSTNPLNDLLVAPGLMELSKNSETQF